MEVKIPFAETARCMTDFPILWIRFSCFMLVENGCLQTGHSLITKEMFERNSKGDNWY